MIILIIRYIMSNNKTFSKSYRETIAYIQVPKSGTHRVKCGVMDSRTPINCPLVLLN